MHKIKRKSLDINLAFFTLFVFIKRTKKVFKKKY